MPLVLRSAWERRGRALDRLKRADLRRGSSTAESRLAWLEDAYRLARQLGRLRNEDPASAEVLRRRRRIGEALAKVRE